MSQLHTPKPVSLGKSGITVNPIAWGMWRFGMSSVPDGRALVEAALAAGVTLFDTADIYGFGSPCGFGGAEALLGKVFAEAPDLRARMILATKGGITPPVPYDASAPYLAAAIDASLVRLGIGQIDLYQLHRPDILTHPQEVARVLEDAVAAGKVRAVGVSNYTVAQTRALAAHCPVPLVSHQPEFSPLHLEALTDGVFDHALETDMAVLAWSPLGGGRLGDPADARGLRVAAALDAHGAAFGVGRAAVVYSWIMAHPVRAIPIVGTQNPARIAAIADSYTVTWTRGQWYDVLVAARGEALP